MRESASSMTRRLLARTDVASERLARFLRLAECAQEIVSQLKGDANGLGEAPEARKNARTCSRQNGS
jgi:hypothetical protein